MRLEGWDGVWIEASCRPFKYYCIKKKAFIYFLAALGLCHCEGFSLFSESRGYSLAAVCRLLSAVASHVALWLLWLKGAKASVFAVSGSRAQAPQLWGTGLVAP